MMSVTVTFVKATVIGGLHDGWKVAVTVSEKSAFPFWTGSGPEKHAICVGNDPGASVVWWVAGAAWLRAQESAP
jgi:hypothetical protein